MNEGFHNCKDIHKKEVSFQYQTGSSRRGKKVLIIGESLPKEGWTGKGLYTLAGKISPTGKKLNEELCELSLGIDECAFTEIAKCHIGKNRRSLSVCGALCAEHLLRQISYYRPKVIFSLGVVTKELLAVAIGVDLLMGEMSQVRLMQQQPTFFVLPLYYPSPINPLGHKRNIKILQTNKKYLLSLI